MSSSHLSSTVNQSNTHANLTDTDLTALFVSSLIASTSNDSIDNTNNNNNNNTMEDAFISQFSDLVYSPSSMIDHQSLGPPPGFEHFRFDSSNSTDFPLNQLINQTNAPVSSADTINFSQLLTSTIAGMNYFALQFDYLLSLSLRFPTTANIDNGGSSSFIISFIIDFR